MRKIQAGLDIDGDEEDEYGDEEFEEEEGKGNEDLEEEPNAQLNRSTWWWEDNNYLSVIYLKTQISSLVIHRRLHSSRLSLLVSCSYFPYLLFLSKSFQNLNVSSAEAVHRVDWSGDCAMCRTLWVCPCNSVTFLHIGSDNADLPTFHTQSWLSTYPWELMSYFC